MRHVYNYVGCEQFDFSSPDPVPEGRHVLRYECGRPANRLQRGQGNPGTAQLYLDGTLAASAHFLVTTPIIFDSAPELRR